MCPKCLRVKLAQGLSLTSLKLRLTVPGVFLQAFFLVDDDVLNVLHGQVIAESVEEDVFQLLQGDLLHVKLQHTRERERERDEQETLRLQRRIVDSFPPSFRAAAINLSCQIDGLQLKRCIIRTSPCCFHDEQSPLVVEEKPTEKPHRAISGVVESMGAKEEAYKIREAFKVLDRDGNGFISKQELGMAMRSLGYMPSEVELAIIMQRLDMDDSCSRGSLTTIISILQQHIALLHSQRFSACKHIKTNQQPHTEHADNFPLR
ncbi:hypothetical protein CCH79_00020255 [Gambusia affinis]|uniref:EF-hand domain-containing protein n=1 Tax=Gambusia affinis TaxID=33528 RepID=A0A315VXT3_GAMAF|nr:hypothetical protein CCH79_00020255 [Gambusia affinis]